MNATADQLLDVARSQLGVREQPPGSNDVLYSRWYPMVGEPWCAMFASWCMDQVGGLGTLMVKHAYCPTGANWFRDKGLWHVRSPKVGDVIYFQWPGWDRPCHIGFVENVYADGTVDTLEGNTDSAGGRTGGRVMRQHRTKYIAGYGSPAYGQGQPPEEPMPSAEQIADVVWNRFKVYEKDGTLKKTFGEAMTAMYQAGLDTRDGTLAIAVCEQVWKRYKVYDEKGNLVPLLTAIQDIYQDVNALRAGGG